MKILLDSYNLCTQYPSGGIQVRINEYYNALKKQETVKLYNKWEDKILNYDIIHFFKPSIDTFSMLEFAKKNNLKVVISPTMPCNESYKIKISKILSKIHINTATFFISKSLNLADAIIVQSNKEKEYINKNFKIDSAKIYSIPNGVRTDMLNGDKELIRKKLNIDKEFVLQVGRFDSNKNQLNVIRAMKDTNVPVVFVGGPYLQEVEYYNECKKEAGKNIYFLGWLDRSDKLLSSIYANAKVLVLPSYSETFGNVLLEGGVCGANLVATKELPIFDWPIKKFCSFIEPDNIDDIKKKIIYSYDLDRNDECRKYILKKFSWESISKEHIKIYKKILNKEGQL